VQEKEKEGRPEVLPHSYPSFVKRKELSKRQDFRRRVLPRVTLEETFGAEKVNQTLAVRFT